MKPLFQLLEVMTVVSEPIRPDTETGVADYVR